MQKASPKDLIETHRLDRTLTAPPLRSNPERSLTTAFCLLLQLPPAEARVLMKLVKHDHATKQEVHTAIADGNPASDIKIVDVIICNLRKKLASHGVKIVTIWGLGFKLEKSSREKLREILNAHGEDVIAATTPADRTKNEAA